MLMWVSPYWIAQFFARMVMPRSFSISLRVHHPLADLLVFTESAGLAQELVDQRGFAMVDVGDDGAGCFELARDMLESVNRIDRDGGDIIGMTGMPEAALARELEIPYAALCVVANWAAGRADSLQGIEFAHIEHVLRGSLGRARHIIEGFCNQ
jgi:hypothetical protein